MPAVPGFVVMELVQTAQNAAEVQRKLKLVSDLSIVWPTGADCARALADFARLHPSHRLGLIDALIAATVIGAGAILCTFNVKHYRAVPGLAIAQPYTR